MTSSLVLLAPLRIEARAARRGAPTAEVLRTGMGPRRSKEFVARWSPPVGGGPLAPPSLVIVSGFGGGLGPDAKPGDVVVATELRVTGAADPSAVATPLDLPMAADLVAQLESAGHRVHLGPLVSSPVLVRGRERRGALYDDGAVAVDMESWWLAEPYRCVPQAARPETTSARFGVVRVLTDSAADEVMSPAILRNVRTAYRVLRDVAALIESWNNAPTGTGNRAPLRESSSQEVES
jgi:4-hydroxy-3-methylbut-2-en-1-yl diphosphate reductase